MHLLEEIYELTNESYLSDLKIPEKVINYMELIKGIPDNQYSVEEWKYVFSYIVGRASNCTDVSQIKEELEQYVEDILFGNCVLSTKGA